MPTLSGDNILIKENNRFLIGEHDCPSQLFKIGRLLEQCTVKVAEFVN
jgi:hypothetical protein